MPLTIDQVPVAGVTRDAVAAAGLPQAGVPAPVAEDWARSAAPQVRTLLVAR